MGSRLARVLVGAAVGFALTTFVPIAAPGAVVPSGPRLAISRNTLFPYRFDIETVDETGAQPQHLVGGGPRKRPLPEEFTPPSWSPDGSMLVFAGLAGKIDQGSRAVRLYVSSADGSDLRPLKGTHGADEPKFAPDNTTVFFTRYWQRTHVNRRGKKEVLARGASIWSINVSGGAPRRVTPSKNGLWMYPDSFSPDGRTLLADQSVKRGPQNVVKVQLDTGATEVLLRHAVEPVYSPAGRRIAFIRWHRRVAENGANEWDSDLYSIRAEGGGLRRITHGTGSVFSESWDPSGERLAFVRSLPEWLEPEELGYGSAVMQVNADGSCLGFVLRPSLDVAFFGVSWQPGPDREAWRIEC
jgi:Tol biopolymer transport system component